MAAVIHLFGFDASTCEDKKFLSVLSRVKAVAAGKKQYESLRRQLPQLSLPPCIPVVPVASCFHVMEETLQQGDVMVLASGDPLFFGIGRRILESFARHDIEIVPAVSSMQLAFARFKIPWDDARFVSLHGRSRENLASQLLGCPKALLLTDPTNSPNVIAESLLAEWGSAAADEIRCHVGEKLGTTEERLFCGTLEETAETEFSGPNVLILVNPACRKSSFPAPRFGLSEGEICHSRGLITKNEVRAAVIHALRPEDGDVVWDVGAGSGSVGLEIARLLHGVSVFSIEKEEEQWCNIEENREKFAAWNMTLVRGAAPDALHGLRAPDRVFVGGSGGNLRAILEYCAARLKDAGVIVVNAVIEKTATLAPQVLHEQGFDIEIKEMAVTRYSYPEGLQQQFNPIKIIVATRADRGDQR